MLTTSLPHWRARVLRLVLLSIPFINFIYSTTVSRREREEIKAEREKAKYDRMHAAGKTEEARADLARLAIIKKQRAEAAAKKKAMAEAAAAAKEK